MKIINEKKYELVENYKDGFSQEDANEKLTEFFDQYDYIVGDWAYGKLRLKGFCLKENKKYKEINDYNNIKTYLKELCAYDCKYFILKKINNL